MKSIVLSFILLIISSCGKESVSVAPSAIANKVTLSWDASPSAGVVGYKIYYNDAPELPFNSTDALEGASPVALDNILSASLTGFSAGSTIYFAVTAYDAAGYESSYSNIVSTTFDANGKQVKFLDTGIKFRHE